MEHSASADGQQERDPDAAHGPCPSPVLAGHPRAHCQERRETTQLWLPAISHAWVLGGEVKTGVAKNWWAPAS